MPRILLVEDSPVQAKMIRFVLEADGFDVETAGSAEEGFKRLESEDFELVITDLMLPGADARKRGAGRIRTADRGFAIRCHSDPTSRPAQELGAQGLGEVPTMVPNLPDAHSDRDLARLNTAWPTLPLYIKTALLALIDASGAAAQTSPTCARSATMSQCSGSERRKYDNDKETPRGEDG